jgi:hypothetical protein
MTTEEVIKYNIELARDFQKESRVILKYCENKGTINQQDIADVVNKLYTSVDCLIQLISILLEDRNKKTNVVVEQVDLDDEFGAGFTKELSAKVEELKKQGKL